MNTLKIASMFFIILLTISGTSNAQCEGEKLPVEIDLEKKAHVCLTDLPGKCGKMREWLLIQFSGYPDLARVLLKLCKDTLEVPGAYVPLDVIEGFCRKIQCDPPCPIIRIHKPEVVKKAFVEAWCEKNGIFPCNVTFEYFRRD